MAMTWNGCTPACLPKSRRDILRSVRKERIRIPTFTTKESGAYVVPFNPTLSSVLRVIARLLVAGPAVIGWSHQHWHCQLFVLSGRSVIGVGQ
jgi:hypothetical protein